MSIKIVHVLPLGIWLIVQFMNPIGRKVAVPVPDGYTWGDFIAQVKTKLKITGVKEIFLAAVRLQSWCLEVALDSSLHCCSDCCRAGKTLRAWTSCKTSMSYASLRCEPWSQQNDLGPHDLPCHLSPCIKAMRACGCFACRGQSQCKAMGQLLSAQRQHCEQVRD